MVTIFNEDFKYNDLISNYKINSISKYGGQPIKLISDLEVEVCKKGYPKFVEKFIVSNIVYFIQYCVDNHESFCANHNSCLYSNDEERFYIDLNGDKTIIQYCCKEYSRTFSIETNCDIVTLSSIYNSSEKTKKSVETTNIEEIRVYKNNILSKMFVTFDYLTDYADKRKKTLKSCTNLDYYFFAMSCPFDAGVNVKKEIVDMNGKVTPYDSQYYALDITEDIEFDYIEAYYYRIGNKLDFDDIEPEMFMYDVLDSKLDNNITRLKNSK